MKVSLEAIVQLPIFIGLPTPTVTRILEYAEIREFPPGSTIVEQNQVGTEFFVVVEGQAQIISERPDGTVFQISVLSPGDAFGEIALIQRTTRTATVRATENLKAIVIQKKYFDLIFLPGSVERKSLTENIRRGRNRNSGI